MNFDFSPIGPFLAAPLVLFVIYRRFRRSFGQQPLRPLRMQVRIGLLLLIGCLLLPATLQSFAFTSAVPAGVVAGAALALWGASLTRCARPRGGRGLGGPRDCCRGHAAKSADAGAVFRPA